MIPGLKILPLSDAPPRALVWFPTICSTVTTVGIQLTLGFQDTGPLPVGLLITDAELAVECGEKARATNMRVEKATRTDLRQVDLGMLSSSFAPDWEMAHGVFGLHVHTMFGLYTYGGNSTRAAVEWIQMYRRSYPVKT